MITPNRLPDLKPRQKTDFAVSTVVDESTCGYADGDRQRPRTANSGYNCRVDAAHGIWGFCSTTLISASDCGLAGGCVDVHSCKTGCSIVDYTSVTTWTWCTSSGNDYCSTALLTAGPDQTYAYLGCASTASTQHLLVQFTTPTDTPSSSSSSTTAKAVTTATPSTSSPTATSTSSTTAKAVITATLSTSSPTATSTSSTTAKAVTTATPSTSSPTATSTCCNNTNLRLSTVPSSATLSPAPTAARSSSKPWSQTGAIVGGVLGVLAFICLIVIGLILLRRHMEQKKDRWHVRTTWQASYSLQLLNAGRNTSRKETKYGAHGFMPVELSGELQDSPVELSGAWQSVSVQRK